MPTSRPFPSGACVGVMAAPQPPVTSRARGLFVFVAVLALLACGAAAAPIRPKIVILTTFESGQDTGDAPGELQFWVEREHLTHSLTIPGLPHPILSNDDGVYAMVTGTCNRSGLALMLLGLDPRFDLSRTYWMIAGIAGTDADKASVGSAAWARWVVDGDNVNEIDGHDYPANWPFGILPYGSHAPDEPPGPGDWSQKPMAFELNPKLVQWAYDLTKNTPLPDSPAIRAFRSAYAGQPAAQRPPFVLIGDALGTARYWHGPALTRWANSWVKVYTQGHGHFVMTDCEDQSLSYALFMLGRAGRVDPNRELVLRTASNYSTPPRHGKSVVESLLTGEDLGTIAAAESAYRVGAPVIHELVQHWDRYQYVIPGN
ncbi:MAG TPA: purine nucleoside permease [Opitutus sp.]|nr:purine nucleoside permease [Opitutus sp.]